MPAEQLRLELRIQYVYGIDLQIPLPRSQQTRKFLRVFAERGEKDLRGAHPQSVENGERVLVHLPQK